MDYGKAVSLAGHAAYILTEGDEVQPKDPFFIASFIVWRFRKTNEICPASSLCLSL